MSNYVSVMPVDSNRGKGEILFYRELPMQLNWQFRWNSHHLPSILCSSASMALHTLHLLCSFASVHYCLGSTHPLGPIWNASFLGKFSHLPCHNLFLLLAHESLWGSLPLDYKFPNNKTHVTFFSNSLGSAQPLLQWIQAPLCDI